MNDAAPIAATSAVPVYAPGPVPAVNGKIGVLLVNLGTPDGADAASVRRYLKEFLSDPRVIENQGVVWQLALNGVILPHPPAAQGARLRQDLEPGQERIPAQDHHPLAGREARRRAGAAAAPRLLVDWAMRYGNPSIASRLADLVAQRLRAHSRRPALSAVLRRDHGDGGRRGLSRARAPCGSSRRCGSRAPYYDDPVYIEALASSTSGGDRAARFQARCHPRVVPRHTEGLCRQGRSLLHAMRRDHAAAARRARPRRSRNCC